MTAKSFIPPRRTLMGPGPSDVSDRVLQALARPTIGHLDPAFVGMMDEMLCRPSRGPTSLTSMSMLLMGVPE